MYPERITSSIRWVESASMISFSCVSRLDFLSVIDMFNSIAIDFTLCLSAFSNPATPTMLEITNSVRCGQFGFFWWRIKASIPEPEPEIKTAMRSGFSGDPCRIAIITGKWTQLMRLGPMRSMMFEPEVRGVWVGVYKQSTRL